MRPFSKQHYLVLLMVAVCLFIFGFTKETQAAQSGKGWYQNFFSSGSVCGEGKWTAKVNVFDTSAAPLTAGTIEIRAILWVGDIPTDIYSSSFSNTSTVVVCISATGSQADLMALDVRVSKTNYKDLWSYQKARPAGSAIANMTWTRNIYLARNDEPVNIAHRFPVDNQVVSNSQNISFEIDTLLRSGSSQVSEIILEAINETTNESFVKSFVPPQSMVQEGTIIFPSEVYPEGRYLWRVRLMEDENNFLYPNLNYDQFILDITPPVVDYPETSYPLSATANITLTGEAQDTLSGLKKIEIYLGDVLKKTCSYSGTTLKQSCSVNVGVLGQGTFTVKVVAEDMGGLIKEKTRTFIIGDKASITFVAWGVGLSDDMQGVEYYHSSGFGRGKTYETTYSFESTSSITTTLRFPVNINFGGEPYQLWGGAGCNLQFQFSSDYRYVICGASAGVGETKDVGALYSNSIRVSALVVSGGSTWGIPVDIKNISGTVDDFKAGETRETTFYIKSYEPVEATLEAPATVSLSSPYIPLEEAVFSYWWRRSDYLPYGCNSISGRNCYIKVGPLYSKLLDAYYVPAPNKLEVFSFVNRKEVGGALISRVSGTSGTGGTTKYLVSKNSVIQTTLRAPLSHGGETFSRWTGCDSQDISGRTCNIRSETSGTKRIAANFGVGNVDPSINSTLTVIMTGTKDDLVFVDPPGIGYPATEGNFSYTYPLGLEVDLKAVPSASSSFVWGGDCSGKTTDTCVLTMDSDKTVTVGFELGPAPPTVDIKANGSDIPILIAYNTPATLSWTSTNTTSCIASNGWSGNKATSSSESTGNLTSSKTYTITCTGPGGSASDSVTVNVSAAFNQRPDKPTGAVVTLNNCLIQELSTPIFQWSPYSDQDDVPPGADPQTFTEIKIYGETTLDETIPCPCSNNYSPPSGWITSNLLWGESYSWQVRVKDSNDNWSEWSDLNSFTMPDHAFPWPDFSHTPQNPSVGQVVTFTDKSKCYSSIDEYDCKYGGVSIQYAWDFDYDTPPDFTDSYNKGDATTTYSQLKTPGYEVRLKITDNTLFGPDNYCIGKGDSPVGIGLPLPKWKEVPPIF
jgi:hypothetical protein